MNFSKLNEIDDNSLSGIIDDLSCINEDLYKELIEKYFNILKPGGYLMLFFKFQYRRIVIAEDLGFEVRDTISWLYNNEEFKELKPDVEFISMLRKPVAGNIVDNVIKYGVGGLNIDDCRIALKEEDKKDLRIIHRSGKLEEGVFNKNNCGLTQEDNVQVLKEQGRFPSNVILTYDKNDYNEVCKGFPESKGSRTQNVFTNTSKYGGNSLFKSSTKRIIFQEGYNDNGSAARYFYNAKLDDLNYKKPISLIKYLLKLIIPSDGKTFSLFLEEEIKYCIKEENNKNWRFMEVKEDV